MRKLEEKIKGLKELKKITAVLKKHGKKIIFTNGCFDILHYGHAKYLQEAKKKGGVLVVAVNSDSSVKKIKGGSRPVIPEKDRSRTLAALESVDYVVLFREVTPLKTIETLKPDILVKGSDWDRKDIVGSDYVKRHAGEVVTIKLLSGRSTTNLIKKIARKF
jgi:rfaE bifunctional protein nucleotidyltransferase chain/domain